MKTFLEKLTENSKKYCCAKLPSAWSDQYPRWKEELKDNNGAGNVLITSLAALLQKENLRNSQINVIAAPLYLEKQKLTRMRMKRKNRSDDQIAPDGNRMRM